MLVMCVGWLPHSVRPHNLLHCGAGWSPPTCNEYAAGSTPVGSNPYQILLAWMPSNAVTGKTLGGRTQSSTSPASLCGSYSCKSQPWCPLSLRSLVGPSDPPHSCVDGGSICVRLGSTAESLVVVCRKDIAHIWEIAGGDALTAQLTQGSHIFLTHRQVRDNTHHNILCAFAVR